MSATGNEPFKLPVLGEVDIEAELKKFEEEERARLGLSDEKKPWTDSMVDPQFKASQRESTTLLVSGLTQAHDFFMQGALKGLGYNVEVIDMPDNDALRYGKEFGNRGQCNPTYYTVGNLVKYLQTLRTAGVEDIEKKYVFITAGACGPCRFGMYEAEYRKALRDSGFTDFRVLIFQQSGGLEEAGKLGDGQEEAGIKLDARFFLTLLRAMIASDIVNTMAYMVRPYEVEPGATDQVVQEARDLLAESFRHNRSTWKTLRRVRRLYDTVEVDYTRAKPKVKITGEFWAQTTEGDGSYHLQSWLEAEGAQVLTEPVGTWIDYILWSAITKQKDRLGLRKGARKKMLALYAGLKMYKGLYTLYRGAMGFHTPPLVSQKKLAEVADDYYNVRIGGGEGHMEVGKHILATVEKKAHMVTSIKPFGCMPSTQSDGVQSKVMAKLKDSIFIPIETSGDGEVNIKSRVQMKLFEAKVKARGEMQLALDEHGLTLDEVQEYVSSHPKLRRPTQHLPHLYVGTAPNFVAKVAGEMGRKRRVAAPAETN
jgi:predicted nucleotide-binding protein (sugar kinase/HSP70/actin superfamily)